MEMQAGLVTMMGTEANLRHSSVAAQSRSARRNTRCSGITSKSSRSHPTPFQAKG